MKTGIELIAGERQRQIDKYGFTGEHHANHPEWYDKGQLLYAASSLIPFSINGYFGDRRLPKKPENWDADWWSKLLRKPHTERLIIAATFVAAELDRINSINHDPKS